jgi:hypothetical protein
MLQFIRSIEVIDVIGKRVRVENNILESSYSLNRESLPAGMYFIRVTTEKGQATHKVTFR